MGGNNSKTSKQEMPKRKLLPDEYICPFCGGIHKREAKLLKQDNQKDKILALNLLNDDEIKYILKNYQDREKRLVQRGKNKSMYQCKKNNDQVMITRIDTSNIKETIKNSIISKIKIFASKKSQNSLKIIESYLLKEEKKGKEKQKEYLYIVTECCEGDLELYLSGKLQRPKLTLPEISDIICQICNSLYYFYKNEVINGYIDMKNILFKSDKIFKFSPNFNISNFEDNKNLISPEILEGKDSDLDVKTDIWYLGLILYRLFKGEELNYENNYESLKNKIKDNIIVFNDFIKNIEYNENEINKLRLFHNLVKRCLTIKEKNRLNFYQFVSHPFFNTILVGRMEDNIREYKEGEDKDFLNISLINLPKMFFNQLDLNCFGENTVPFGDLGEYINDFEDKIKKEDEKDKLKEIIIYKLLESENEDEDNIKNILSNINKYKETYFDFMFPFILFIGRKKKEIETKVKKIIQDKNMSYLDMRFIFYCENSNIKEIKHIIYRAYSYYNECGDIFNLGETTIDLRKNKFDFYFNIICIARSQMGKSTFINRYISSFNPGEAPEVRAKEGGNEKACSTKFAQYYINNYPLKVIDIIGYDGEQDTIEKLNDIVNQMSIILEQNEIHIILYLIKYDTDTLFFKNEVAIFERLRLNAIKPKILFIRTQCKINIYQGSEEENEYNLDILNPREKRDIEKKLQLMNTNFKTIKQGNDWKNIIKYIFSKIEEQEVTYFDLNNVCFMNLCLKEEINGTDIKPFGMKYFKRILFKLLQQIREEESSRVEKWLKLQEKLKDDNVDIVNIIKEMNFYNIYTNSLSEEAIELYKTLIDRKMNTRIKIDVQDIPEIMVLFSRQGLIFMFNFFNYRIKKNKEDNTTNIIINKRKFKEIINDFITYKTLSISSIEFFFNQNQEDNNVINNLLLNESKEENNQNNDLVDNNNNLNIEINENLNPVNIDTVINNLIIIKNNKTDSFMISVLHCLIHFEPLISSIFKKQKSLKKISKEFFNLCVILVSNNLISLNHFKNCIDEKNFADIKIPIEFLIYFFQKIKKEISKKEELNKIEYENNTKEESFSKYEEEYIKKQNNNFIENIFYIHFISSFVCTHCNYNSYLFEEEIKISLKMNDEEELNIYNYFTGDQIEKYCSKCKIDTMHYKNKKIYHPPEILIINVQKGSNISFKEKLEINDLIDKDLKLNIKYQIIAVINCEINEGNAVYFSYIKINDNWCKFGDKEVEENEPNFTKACPSVLFYKKINEA